MLPLSNEQRQAKAAERELVAGQVRAASPWLTTEEARHMAKVGLKSLYREIKAGRLRAARLGGRSGAIRIHRDWVDAWLIQSATPVEIGRR